MTGKINFLGGPTRPFRPSKKQTRKEQLAEAEAAEDARVRRIAGEAADKVAALRKELEDADGNQRTSH